MWLPALTAARSFRATGTRAGSIVRACVSIKHVVRGARLMSEMQERIAAYRRVMAMVRSMVLQGVVSEKEYGKIDTIMAKKFGLSSSTIFR